MRANWKKIGADIDVQHYASALFFAPLQMGGLVYSNKWDMIAFGMDERCDRRLFAHLRVSIHPAERSERLALDQSEVVRGDR